MVPRRAGSRGAVAAAGLAVVLIYPLQARGGYGSERSTETAEEFSPLFTRRLELGIGRMDEPPGRVIIAGLGLVHDDPLGTPASGNPLSGCLGSGCLGSLCLGSLCVASRCLGSACVSSACIGSGCTGSGCAGSACIDSRCVGSVCVQTGCLGSACLSCPESDTGGIEAEG